MTATSGGKGAPVELFKFILSFKIIFNLTGKWGIEKLKGRIKFRKNRFAILIQYIFISFLDKPKDN